ncbi:MAG: DNA-3-methyladenine glycosylase I [Planctomycetia bacterium]|nr:DNA-3-methyladenine glycosylase I [Planctomycetia bacterium]
MAYCTWGLDESSLHYHDEEWGVPIHDDNLQFEYLLLAVMQCGLNWKMVLKKYEILSECFANFDFERIASFDEFDVERILNTTGMIRSRRKIEAIINNARAFIQIREKYGSFSKWLWSFSDGKSISYIGHEKGLIPMSNGLSERITKAMKKEGFKFVGSIMIYSHLQGCGIINDHGDDCHRYHELMSQYPSVRLPCEHEKFSR